MRGVHAEIIDPASVKPGAVPSLVDELASQTAPPRPTLPPPPPHAAPAASGDVRERQQGRPSVTNIVDLSPLGADFGPHSDVVEPVLYAPYQRQAGWARSSRSASRASDRLEADSPEPPEPQQQQQQPQQPRAPSAALPSAGSEPAAPPNSSDPPQARTATEARASLVPTPPGTEPPPSQSRRLRLQLAAAGSRTGSSGDVSTPTTSSRAAAAGPVPSTPQLGSSARLASSTLVALTSPTTPAAGGSRTLDVAEGQQASKPHTPTQASISSLPGSSSSSLTGATHSQPAAPSQAQAQPAGQPLLPPQGRTPSKTRSKDKLPFHVRAAISEEDDDAQQQASRVRSSADSEIPDTRWFSDLQQMLNSSDSDQHWLEGALNKISEQRPEDRRGSKHTRRRSTSLSARPTGPPVAQSTEEMARASSVTHVVQKKDGSNSTITDSTSTARSTHSTLSVADSAASVRGIVHAHHDAGAGGSGRRTSSRSSFTGSAPFQSSPLASMPLYPEENGEAEANKAPKASSGACNDQAVGAGALACSTAPEGQRLGSSQPSDGAAQAVHGPLAPEAAQDATGAPALLTNTSIQQADAGTASTPQCPETVSRAHSDLEPFPSAATRGAGPDRPDDERRRPSISRHVKISDEHDPPPAVKHVAMRGGQAPKPALKSNGGGGGGASGQRARPKSGPPGGSGDAFTLPEIAASRIPRQKSAPNERRAKAATVSGGHGRIIVESAQPVLGIQDSDARPIGTTPKELDYFLLVEKLSHVPSLTVGDIEAQAPLPGDTIPARPFDQPKPRAYSLASYAPPPAQMRAPMPALMMPRLSDPAITARDRGMTASSTETETVDESQLLDSIRELDRILTMKRGSDAAPLQAPLQAGTLK
nr:hypothetical protein HK105_004209 [Polyrhizophydium stewartii]